MSVSHGKSRALKRFLRNKFRTPQKQNLSEPQGGSQTAALDKGPAYSLSTEIPQNYNDKYVRIIPRDPQHAFVYWEQSGNNKDGEDRNAGKRENDSDNKRDVIKIQHIPAFQSVRYPQTVCNFQTDNAAINTVAQINPQSNIGCAYVQTPCSGGEIRAEYGIESSDPQKTFEIMAASPAVENSEPTIKQIADIKKGVDTAALTALSSVNLSGIGHLSSGELYNTDTVKKS